MGAVWGFGSRHRRHQHQRSHRHGPAHPRCPQGPLRPTSSGGRFCNRPKTTNSQRDERAPMSRLDRQVAGLIWDMDGTLIDSATVVPDPFIATTTALGGTACTREEVVALYSLGEPAAMLGHMLDRPATSAEVDAYHQELARRADGVRPYPGIKAALAALRPRLRIGVFTGASTRAAEIL